jgi:hypothetical protein
VSLGGVSLPISGPGGGEAASILLAVWAWSPWPIWKILEQPSPQNKLLAGFLRDRDLVPAIQ